jgi:hypothetical protein
MLTQKKEDGMCCHECLPRRKKMGCAAMNAYPEERRWDCCHECLPRRKKMGCAAMNAYPEERRWDVLP